MKFTNYARIHWINAKIHTHYENVSRGITDKWFKKLFKHINAE